MQQFDQNAPGDLQEIAARIMDIAKSHEAEPERLLEVLRILEQLHRNICDNLFQPALPRSRHGLFDLLRDIETNGGWPYIYRIRLRDLCQNLQQELDKKPD